MLIVVPNICIGFYTFYTFIKSLHVFCTLFVHLFI